MIKLREDFVTNVSLNGGFDAREYRPYVLDDPVVSAYSTYSGDICIRDGMVFH